MYDVVIIGGGASGLAAAIELKMSSPDLSVAIFEKNDSLGKKLRATGNGRCNITNENADGYNEIMEFFTKIGIVTRTYENGLVYPYSESAADVVDLLSERVRELEVEVKLNSNVEKIEKKENYEIKFVQGEKKGMAEARKVILAVGGKAGPDFGTIGDGYAMARSKGHSIVAPIPALTGVECADWDISLAGIRARAKVCLYKDETEAFDEETKVFEELGEVQFTKYGLSGICIFNMTRHMRYNKADGETLDQFLIRLDLFADGEIREYLAGRAAGAASLRTLLRPALADFVLKRGLDSVHSLEFRPSGIRGWRDAQVTSGGVPLSEIIGETCESKICAGLYITGELLDYDGPCGGYNLSNAWLTGIHAAKDINEKLK